jgi:peptide/nickel transport system substrate-binding protein
MKLQASMAYLNRRSFLKGVGARALAVAGVGSPTPLLRRSWGARPTTKLVSTWNAFDVLDPHVKYDVSAAAFNLNMYDNLLRYQGNPPQIVPWLAERDEAADGGRRWTFHLRRGVKFHDGSELTAEAVHYSFARLLALGKGPSAIFKRMGLTAERIRVGDAYTVQFSLDQPFGPFRVAIPLVSIVNPALLKAHEQDGDWGEKWLARNDAGSGAFRLVKADASSRLTMERFPEFWRGWQAKHLDEVEIRVIREQSSQILALMKGDVHIVQGNLPADQLERLEKHPRITVTPQESMRILLIRMHNQREPFTDINVRKAFNHAFNYDSFIKDILKNRVVRNPGPTPRPLWGYPEDVAGYDYDLDKAKAYLAKAHVKITRPLDLHVQVTGEQSLQAGLLFQSDLAKLDIEARLVKALFPTLTASTKTQETTPDMWIHWVSTYYVDPENWIGEMYDSSNWGTWKASSWYKNPEVDALLDQARRLVNQDQRAKLYEEAYRLVVADAADIWIYNTLEHVPIAKVVQGFQFSPVGSGQEFWSIFLSVMG